MALARRASPLIPRWGEVKDCFAGRSGFSLPMYEDRFQLVKAEDW
jgi:hypothetical protein